MKKLFCALFVNMVLFSFAPDFAHAEENAACKDIDHTHAKWEVLLDKYVKNGFVDYASLKKPENRKRLGAYLNELQSVCKSTYDGWKDSQKIAYWINVYNAYIVELILRNYPLKSIRKIGWLPGAAFRRKFIPIHILNRRDISLDTVEHKILRKKFKEPRIHFAIVCASKSCPMLPSDAFVPSRLESQLKKAGKTFLNDPTRNQYDEKTRTLKLSEIFKWVKEDFGGTDEKLKEFIVPFFEPKVAKKIKQSPVTIEFLKYDWSLNGK